MLQVPPAKIVPFSSPGFAGTHRRKMCPSKTVEERQPQIRHETFVTAKRDVSIQPTPGIQSLNTSPYNGHSVARIRDAQFKTIFCAACPDQKHVQAPLLCKAGKRKIRF